MLHAYSSERRVALGIPPSMPFTEESTFWNPAWGTPIGAAETTTVTDMATTAVATTFLPGAFDADGVYDNSSDRLFRQIATELAPAPASGEERLTRGLQDTATSAGSTP